MISFENPNPNPNANPNANPNPNPNPNANLNTTVKTQLQERGAMRPSACFLSPVCAAALGFLTNVLISFSGRQGQASAGFFLKRENRHPSTVKFEVSFRAATVVPANICLPRRRHGERRQNCCFWSFQQCCNGGPWVAGTMVHTLPGWPTGQPTVVRLGSAKKVLTSMGEALPACQGALLAYHNVIIARCHNMAI